MFGFKTLSTTILSAVAFLGAMSVTLSAEDTPKVGTQPEQQDAAKPATDTKVAKTESDDDVDERDYYTRRAQEMLKDDNAVDSKPHPLAKNYPDQFVVVCEGGCKNRQAHIVDFEPRKQKHTIEIGEMIPTASGGAEAFSATQAIQCIGGCTRQDDYADDFDLSAADNDWDTTTSPAVTHQGDESGRWLSQ